MAVDLPTEIYDLFFEKLDLEHTKPSLSALRACSLVSRTLCTSTRRRLFSNIEIWLVKETSAKIPFAQYQKYLSDTCTLLQESAKYSGIGMVYYLHTFKLIMGHDEDGLLLPLKKGNIAGLLNALHGPDHGIRNFALELFIPKAICYDQLPKKFQRALFDLINSPSLRVLLLRNFRRLPNDLLLDTHVKTLLLNFCGAAGSEKSHISRTRSEALDTIKTTHMHMESFSFDDQLPILSLLQSGKRLEVAERCRLAFSQLRQLSIDVRDYKNVPTYMGIALQASQTLEMFVLNFDGYPNHASGRPWPTANPFQLESFVHLRTLTLGKTKTSNSPDAYFLSHVHILENISSLPPNLNVLTIRARTSPSPLPSVINWDRLNNILAMDPFTKIPEVKLSLAYCVRDPPSPPDMSDIHKLWESVAKAGLPATVSVKSLECPSFFDIEEL